MPPLETKLNSMGNESAVKSDQPIFHYFQFSITFCFPLIPVSYHFLSVITSHLHHFLFLITSCLPSLPVSHHFLSPITSYLPSLLISHHFLSSIPSLLLALTKLLDLSESQFLDYLIITPMFSNNRIKYYHICELPTQYSDFLFFILVVSAQ